MKRKRSNKRHQPYSRLSNALGKSTKLSMSNMIQLAYQRLWRRIAAV